VYKRQVLVVILFKHRSVFWTPFQEQGGFEGHKRGIGNGQVGNGQARKP